MHQWGIVAIFNANAFIWAISHNWSEITFSQYTVSLAPILSIFELIPSKPGAVSNLHCFKAFVSSTMEGGFDRSATSSSSNVIIEGRSSLYAVVSTVELELAADANCSFHLLILSSDEKSVCLPSKDFKFVL